MLITKKFKNIDVYIDDIDKSIYLSMKGIASLFRLDYSSVTRKMKGLRELEGIKLQKMQLSTSKKPFSLFPFELIKSLFLLHHTDEIRELENWLNESAENKVSVVNDLYLTNRLETLDFIDESSGLVVNTKVDVEANTVWLNQEQIMRLFHISKPNVLYHLRNIFTEGELDENSVVQYFLTTGLDFKKYKVRFYNLDVVISLGYRIKNKIGIKFRQWANRILKDYMLKGYALNPNRCLVCKDSLLKLENEVNELKKDKHLEQIFYQNNELEAYSFIIKLFRSAKEEIIIIDPYVDNSLLIMLKENKARKVKIYTSTRATLKSNDKYEFIIIDNIHDRFIYIDGVGYMLGGSIKDAGKKDIHIMRIHLKVEKIVS